MSSKAFTVFISLSALTSSWTGARTIYPLYDAFALAALAMLVYFWLARLVVLRIPFWVVLPSFVAIALAPIGAILAEVPGVALGSAIGFASRIVFTTAVPAVLILVQAQLSRRRLRWIAGAWVAGVTLNAFVALLTSVELVNVEGIVEGTTGERAFGLAAHPNTLSLSVALACPVLVTLFLMRGRHVLVRLLSLAGLLLAVNALFTADSRAGLVVGLPALLVSFLVIAFREWRGGFALLLVPLIAIAVIMLAPVVFFQSRLSVNLTRDLSYIRRAELAGAGIETWAQSPIFGTGLTSASGVSVPLLLLSAGGVVLLAAYYTFPLALLSRVRGVPVSWRAAFVLMLLAVLVFGLLNNGYAERVSFWFPLCLVAAYPRVSNRDLSRLKRIT
ncbi:O-antigen ligase [Microbacterium sp. AG1240]|uniref:O-antigen ligase family protein n=1 Tax=Microbacterium sp. AG1240 TaxID=2183992 RepID=UPI0016042A4D|nr:O-antigen ligase family protein [Microbacterium sp. AG1240]